MCSIFPREDIAHEGTWNRVVSGDNSPVLVEVIIQYHAGYDYVELFPRSGGKSNVLRPECMGVVPRSSGEEASVRRAMLQRFEYTESCSCSLLSLQNLEGP